MPAIADQVTTLENDHATALATIDSLRAANTTLSAQLADANKLVDSIKTVVQNVASGALEALSVLHAKAAAIPAEVLANVETTITDVKTEAQTVETKVESALGFVIAVKAAALANPDGKLTADQLGAVNAKQPSPEQQGIVAAIVQAAPGPASPVPVAVAGPQTIPPYGAPAAKPSILAQVEAEVEKIPAAVDRMLHHSSAATTQMRDLQPTLVDHSSEGLPIFLRRDTVFHREGRVAT